MNFGRDRHIDRAILTDGPPSRRPAHMTRNDPILVSDPAKGAQADRLIAILAGLGLLASIGATLWFFAGFYETDPEFTPASSAFLFSIGLGAFAIIPSAIILRLSWSAWRTGFQTHHGVWTLLLCVPWLIFAGFAWPSEWLPLWLSLVPIMIAVPCTLWAIISIVVQHRPLMKS